MFRWKVQDTRIINSFTHFLFSFMIVENFLYGYLGNWSKPRFHSFTWWRHRGARYTYWASIMFLPIKNWYGFHGLLNSIDATVLMLDILYNMWCFARFGTICTIYKTWNVAGFNSSMGIFHVFKIVQMVQNREKASHLFIFARETLK